LFALWIRLKSAEQLVGALSSCMPLTEPASYSDSSADSAPSRTER